MHFNFFDGIIEQKNPQVQFSDEVLHLINRSKYIRWKNIELTFDGSAPRRVPGNFPYSLFFSIKLIDVNNDFIFNVHKKIFFSCELLKRILWEVAIELRCTLARFSRLKLRVPWSASSHFRCCLRFDTSLDSDEAFNQDALLICVKCFCALACH